MARKYTIRSKDEKLEITKEVFAGKSICAWEPEIWHQHVFVWVKKYQSGVPRGNAVIESFWGRFKDTLRKHFRCRERDDLHAVIAESIYYFNFIRPVRKLNGKPPALFRSELVA